MAREAATTAPYECRMPTIVPNLLLLDAESTAIEETTAAIAQFPCQLTVVDDLSVGLQIGTDELFDLLVCDLNIIAPGRRTDDVIAQFHALRGCYDVPVLFISGMQHSGVSLKTHPWGVAYHVHKAIDSQVMIGLLQASLTLKVCEACVQKSEITQPASPTVVPQPFGLTLPLPEVIMPPHSPVVSQPSITLG